MKIPISYADLFWAILLSAIASAYAFIGAGIAGVVSAKTVSLATLSGALVGVGAAFGYLIAGTRELQRKYHHRR